MTNGNIVSNTQTDHDHLLAISTMAKDHPKLNNYAFQKLRQDLWKKIQTCEPSTQWDDIKLSLTPSHIDGDITLDVFYLGKQQSKNPIQLGETLATAIDWQDVSIIAGTASIKGYLNFFVDKAQLVKAMTDEVLSLGLDYGKCDAHQGKVAVIDYSGPNIAKPIGVGHLRSTIIGQSLANIYECMGYTTLKINHIGDWGTQFGALIEAYDHWNDDAMFNQDPIQALKDLYVKFHQEKKQTPSLEDAARARFLLLEKKHVKEYELWQKFRQLSIDSFESVYRLFNVTFDAYQGESFFADRTHAVVEAVKQQALCTSDEGENALVVKDLDGLPTFLLQKEDGASLYITRDLAALVYRATTFKPDTVLYVVGNEQSLHFKQLFALYNAMNHPTVEQLAHIGFGLIMTDGKKMSTRDGTLIELKELVSKAKEKVAEILTEKGNELSDDDVQVIAIGAIIYNDLSRSRTKNIEFNWTTMLSMESGSSVYLQYTYARVGSICRKLKDQYDGMSDTVAMDDVEINDDEVALYLQLLWFMPTIEHARQTNMPNAIATYLDGLAQAVNTYYAKYRIKDSTGAQFVMRYRMLMCIQFVLKNGLKLLTIDTLEKM